jgi:hypothetical protein
MADRSNVKPHDWIKVENVPCVVAVVHEHGDLEVVFSPTKPANVDVKWDGQEWVSSNPSDLGGYADRYPRLGAFVRTLKAGSYAK